MNKKSFKEYFCAKVGIEKKSHSRGFLSAVYTTFKNESGGDPRLQPSGMTPLFNHGGFTLIELLVVVLIIGILAAVALPQYNKAVKKAQGREVYVAMEALDKALNAYYLENDSYEAPNSSLPVKQENLNITIPELKHFSYGNWTSNGTSSFQVGTFDGNSDTYQVSIRGGGHVDLRWDSGKLVQASCSGTDCAQYFDCPSISPQASSVEQVNYKCDLNLR